MASEGDIDRALAAASAAAEAAADCRLRSSHAVGPRPTAFQVWQLCGFGSPVGLDFAYTVGQPRRDAVPPASVAVRTRLAEQEYRSPQSVLRRGLTRSLRRTDFVQKRPDSSTVCRAGRHFGYGDYVRALDAVVNRGDVSGAWEYAVGATPSTAIGVASGQVSEEALRQGLPFVGKIGGTISRVFGATGLAATAIDIVSC